RGGLLRSQYVLVGCSQIQTPDVQVLRGDHLKVRPQRCANVAVPPSGYRVDLHRLRAPEKRLIAGVADRLVPVEPALNGRAEGGAGVDREVEPVVVDGVFRWDAETGDGSCIPRLDGVNVRVAVGHEVLCGDRQRVLVQLIDAAQLLTAAPR